LASPSSKTRMGRTPAIFQTLGAYELPGLGQSGCERGSSARRQALEGRLGQSATASKWAARAPMRLAPNAIRALRSFLLRIAQHRQGRFPWGFRFGPGVRSHGARGVHHEDNQVVPRFCAPLFPEIFPPLRRIFFPGRWPSRPGPEGRLSQRGVNGKAEIPVAGPDAFGPQVAPSDC